MKRVHPIRPSRKSGFTIFELMMATMVLALGIMTSLIVIQSGFRATDTARNTTIAAQLLQSVLEDIRMLPWNATTPIGTPPVTVSSITYLENNNNNVPGNVTLDASFTNGDAAAIATVNRFTITRNIWDVNSTLKQIDLTATWKGIDGRSHSLKYSTYYAQNGLHDYFVR